MTTVEIQQLRDAWFAAELAVATGQSYTIAGRSLTRADAAFIASRLRYYDGLLVAAASGRGAGVRAVRVMPRDL